MASGRGGVLGDGRDEERGGGAPAAAIAGAALLFAWAALYNGFPFVYYDTQGYVQPHYSALRTPYYSLSVTALRSAGSVWPVVFAQTLLTAHLLHLALRVARGKAPLLPYLAIAAALALGTSLAWVAGQIMADAFTPVVVLGVFLLGFGAERLGRGETAWVFALTAGAIACHLSHVAIAAGLGATALAWRALTSPAALRRAATWGLALGPLALGAAALFAASLATFGLVTLQPAGQTFLMARLVGDGPGRAYLEARCPEAGYALCNHLDREPLTSGYVLWDPAGPLQQKGVLRMREESGAIVAGTLRMHPLWSLETTARNFARQLVTFGTAAELPSYLHVEALTRAVETHLPGARESYRRSRQSRDALPRDLLRGTSLVVVPLSGVATLVLGAALWRSRRTGPLLGLVVAVGVGVIVNAAVCGTVSEPNARFGSRVAWLLSFVALAGLPELRRLYDGPRSRA